MLTNENYKPINCDDYDSLELACQKHWILTITLKDGEILTAKAKDILSRKNVEYLIVESTNGNRECRLDHIASFSHPELGTIVVSESD